MAAYGAENLNIMQDPEMSCFNKVYSRHTNFSMESIEQTFVDTPQFNTTSVITIKKLGDLMSSMYLELTLPFDENLTSSYWTNRVGFNIIKKIELYIGKKLVDRIYGQWMHIWSELTHTIDKKNLLDEMVGSKGTDGITNGLSCNKKHTIVIPLMFSFCRHTGLAIPLLALRDNIDVSLKIFFEKKDNCVQLGTMPSNNISNVKLWVDYIYLEKIEQLQIIQRPIEYIIEVSQHLERNIVTTGAKSIILPFTLSCKELIWIVQSMKPAGDKFTDFTSNSSSMVNYVQLKINSKNVFSSGNRNNTFFNYIMPYQCHTGKPDLGINTYSFAISPEKLEPSGFLNFSHINSITMIINTIGNGILNIYAMSYNILRIEKGDVTMVYKY